MWSSAAAVEPCGVRGVGPSESVPDRERGRAGLPTQPSASPAEPSVPPARWADCGGGFSCAEVRVPRDYAAPSGGYLNISLIRAAATKPKRADRIPAGEPGRPGRIGCRVRAGRPVDVSRRRIRERFDIVGFDPRGVNPSTAIRCIDNLDGHAALDPSPDDAAELTELVDAARDYAEACARRNDATLPYLSTEAVARDLDLIRAAVGDDKLTYLGFSYGTLIGATLRRPLPGPHPGDGARWRDRPVARSRGIPLRPGSGRSKVRSSASSADCAKRTDCAFHEGGQVGGRLRCPHGIDRPQADPRATDRRPAARRPGPRLVGGARRALLRVVLADPRHRASPRRRTATARSCSRSRTRSAAASQTARTRTCRTRTSATPVSTTRRRPTSRCSPAGRATSPRSAPHFAEFVAYNDLVVRLLVRPRAGDAAGDHGRRRAADRGRRHDRRSGNAVPLVRGTRGQLESAVLVTSEGEGHTGYARRAPCVQDAVDDYLLELTVPEDGLTCD